MSLNTWTDVPELLGLPAEERIDFFTVT